MGLEAKASSCWARNKRAEACRGGCGVSDRPSRGQGQTHSRDARPPSGTARALGISREHCGGMGRRPRSRSERGAREQLDAADEVHAASGHSASPWPSQLIQVLTLPPRR